MPAAPSTDHNSSFAYAPGDVIASKYQLEQLLGQGGMGAVFRARNTALDMLVAIKLLRADMNRELLAGRLLQEARAAAKLTHPGIVRVFDVGQTALGDPFIVMELLEGETLSALIDRERRLSPIRAVQLLLPIAEALSAAHHKGLVHRDVKPDNVLLVTSEEGIVQPKLLDFGIVKSVQADGGPSDAGSVVGSPDYMSPEQARGLEQVDARSDLWSFTVVLYEAIAGVTPFRADDHATLLRLVVTQHPKSLKELGLADHALSYIVERGLSKDPLARYDSLTQMGKALAAWLADQGISEDACGVSLETKWLARETEPQALSRRGSPPSRPDPTSGIRQVDVAVGEAAAVHSLAITLPPSSLSPSVDSGRAPPPFAPRRSRRLATAIAATLSLPLGWLAFDALRPEPSQPAVIAAASAPPPAPSVVDGEGRAPLTSTSTAAPATSALAPATSSGPARLALSAQRRPPTPKARPAVSAAPRERLSDSLLAPMPF